MSYREVDITKGGKYEQQNLFTQLITPLLLALVFLAVVCLYFAVVYLEAVLVGRAFGVLLVGAALGLGYVTVRGLPEGAGFLTVVGALLYAIVALAFGALFVYLQLVIPWPWRFEVGGGMLWITGPRASRGVNVAWVAVRWLLVAALPCGLVPTAKALLDRLRMEIIAPNWTATLRATPGQAVGYPFITYPTQRTADEPEETPPPPVYHNA